MPNWASLRSIVDGRVRMPGDTGFDDACKPFNKRFAHVEPQAVLSVGSVADVSRGILWSRANGVPVVARGGGHSYAGNSVNSGLVLDMRGLDEVRVDRSRELVKVGGGTRMRKLYAALQEHDLAIPLGNSDDVSVGGLVLGGGVAAVSRAFGLTCDSLVETEIVLADGSLVTCNETEHAGLFWACRGGGGGNFGVNVSFTFQARPVMPSSTCLLLWDWAHAPVVLSEMQQVMRNAPDEFAARIGVSRTRGEAGVVSVVGQHLGPSEDLHEMLAPVLELATPFRMDIADRTYWEAKDYLHHSTAGDPFAVRTRTVSEPLSCAAVATILKALENWPGSSSTPDGAGVALFTWGGAINRVPVTDTAFPHRDVLFLISMDTSWTDEDTPETVRDNLEWLTELHRDMGEFASDLSYVNFTDPDLEDPGRAYFGPNLERLEEVKRRYDPDRVFTFGQAI